MRLLIDDGVGAADGLACDEVLAARAGQAKSPPTLRLYTYRAHCALVGRFQTVANELHVAACREEGVEINRRPTGGGAILMGPDQLGVALALPRPVAGFGGRARELMKRFSEGIVHALHIFEIAASFQGKNDLVVGGRKVAGLGIARDPGGGLLFHASLLVDLDVDLMTRVLRTPFDHEPDVAASRIATVREGVGRSVGMDEVRARVAKGFARSFDVVLGAGELSDDERRAVETLSRDKYGTDAWIQQQTAVLDRSGSARVETPGGAVEVRVALAGATIKAVHVHGDFFENEGVIADLERRLRWHAADPAAIEQTVAAWGATAQGTLPVAAVAEALTEATRESTPYGCFVTPGGEHA